MCEYMILMEWMYDNVCFFFFQAEDGIRDLVRSRGLGDVYKRQASMNNIADVTMTGEAASNDFGLSVSSAGDVNGDGYSDVIIGCLLYTSDAADERSSVDLGGRRIIKKKNNHTNW